MRHNTFLTGETKIESEGTVDIPFDNELITVHITEGIEGPRYDPFHFIKYRFTILDRKTGNPLDITIHIGIDFRMVFMKDSNRIFYRGLNLVSQKFEELVGMSLERFSSLIQISSYYPK